MTRFSEMSVGDFSAMLREGMGDDLVDALAETELPGNPEEEDYDLMLAEDAPGSGSWQEAVGLVAEDIAEEDWR